MLALTIVVVVLVQHCIYCFTDLVVVLFGWYRDLQAMTVFSSLNVSLSVALREQPSSRP